MSILGFKSRGHPQQVMFGARQTTMFGANDVDDRATTPEVFDPLHARFGFTVDVAAAEHNAKCDRYFTIDDDGLSQCWAGEVVWCNPPYSDIAPWLRKAWDEPDATIVMLLPANRTEQGWWQDHIEPHRDRGGRLTTEFLRGRLRFLKPGQTTIGPNERPPFGCVLAIWLSCTPPDPESETP